MRFAGKQQEEKRPLFESVILEVPADVSSLISAILVAIYAADIVILLIDFWGWICYT